MFSENKVISLSLSFYILKINIEVWEKLALSCLPTGLK